MTPCLKTRGVFTFPLLAILPLLLLSSSLKLLACHPPPRLQLTLELPHFQKLLRMKTSIVNRNLYQIYLFPLFNLSNFTKLCTYIILDLVVLFRMNEKYVIKKNTVQTNTQHSCSNKTTRHEANKFKAEQKSSQI